MVAIEVYATELDQFTCKLNHICQETCPTGSDAAVIARQSASRICGSSAKGDAAAQLRTNCITDGEVWFSFILVTVHDSSRGTRLNIACSG